MRSQDPPCNDIQHPPSKDRAHRHCQAPRWRTHEAPWRCTGTYTHTYVQIRGDQLVLPTRCVHHFGTRIGYVPDGIMKGSVMDSLGCLLGAHGDPLA